MSRAAISAMKNLVTWYGKYTDPSEWPDWFNDALKDGRIAVSSINDRVLYLHGNVPVFPGDEIRRLPNGEIVRHKGARPR